MKRRARVGSVWVFILFVVVPAGALFFNAGIAGLEKWIAVLHGVVALGPALWLLEK